MIGGQRRDGFAASATVIEDTRLEVIDGVGLMTRGAMSFRIQVMSGSIPGGNLLFVLCGA